VIDITNTGITNIIHATQMVNLFFTIWISNLLISTYPR